MSDDLFSDTFGGDNLFEDEEEQQEKAAGEGQNRTFLIAVAVLGGLLACALIAFGVWVLVINPNMQQRAAEQLGGGGVAMVTETPATDAVVESTATPEPTATATPKPTAVPTATPVVGPTATPKDDTATGGDTPTPTPVRERRTETPTPAGGPAATPTKSTTAGSGSTSDSLPDSGLGEIALVAGALLMGVAFLAARKLRSA